MAKGPTHHLANVALTGISGFLLYKYGSEIPVNYQVAWLVGNIFGNLITPDADQTVVDNPNRKRKVTFGEWYWCPYARKYSHRGSSHRPFVGTWTRWSFVLFTRLGIILPIFLFYYFNFSVLEYYPEIVVAFLGNVFIDFGHLALDGFKYYEEGTARWIDNQRQRR